jgi:hypothetical protein
MVLYSRIYINKVGISTENFLNNTVRRMLRKELIFFYRFALKIKVYISFPPGLVPLRPESPGTLRLFLTFTV